MPELIPAAPGHTHDPKPWWPDPFPGCALCALLGQDDRIKPDPDPRDADVIGGYQPGNMGDE